MPDAPSAPLTPMAPMRMISLEAPPDRKSQIPPAPGVHSAPDPGWTPMAPLVAEPMPTVEVNDFDEVVPAPPPPRPPSVSRPDGVPPPPPPRAPQVTRPDAPISRPPPPPPVPGAPVVIDDSTDRISVSDIEEIYITATEEPPGLPPPPVKTSTPPAAGAAPPPPPPVVTSAPISMEAPRTERKRPWFEEVFDDDFLRTMDRPPEHHTLREAVFIEDRLGLQRGAVILDLACGPGRHAVELTRRGYKVIGYDLSLAMLARASDEAMDANQKINFLHGDMREMAFDSMFDGVYCWGTSLGYFEEDKNFGVIQRMHRALRPGGVVLLDLPNRDYVAVNQPSMVWFEGEGCVCMDEMNVDFLTSRLRVKRTVMLDDGRTREIEYSIRLWGLHELGKMLHDAGFRVLEVTGQLATPGVFFGAESPRCIVLAERA